ncbi:hypothetical protein Zm00014a_027315 [Zea mays]|uniref:Uncharacterized protein n=1 Tax=Zea mays TaxID=4577 RepID=A0A317YGI6_MAIZE|nr:hypothetical protein Zm00014a_027315 [Zea mays]
MHRDATPTNIS